MFGPALTLVLALASSAVIASPTLPFHFPGSVYENTPYSGAASFSPSEKDDVKTATDYISNKLNLGADDFKVYNSFTDPSGVTHVYGAHMTNGFRISNHHASAHVKNGQVTSFSSSFGTAQHFAKSDLAVSAPKAALDFAKASDTASAQLGIPVYSEFNKHALEYVEQPDGKIVYAYKLQLRKRPPDQVDPGVGVMLILARSSRLLTLPTRLRTRPFQSLVVMPLKDFNGGRS
ncbi:hypothetical protein BASA83_008364 [Batrachochytrium salamandrivorans]|nr:hypothetical protein BASA83_008364 [Batrachochytrium salamandrivorans]